MIDYQKQVLNNGLSVIVEQDTSTTLAAVNILYKVGSCNENPDRTGFAHLFEHLMFGGSKNAPDFDLPLQTAGGENNAFTNNDYTNYYNVVPVENIETALWLEADRMAHLNINETTLETQRKVVVEEFKEVCLNKPYGDNWHHLSAMAYQEHPYGWPTIGKEIRHIQEAKLSDVQEFYKKFYNPSNAILSISGPLPVDEVFELANKWFGHIPSGALLSDVQTKEPQQTKARYKRITSDVPVRLFIGSCHMPGRVDKEYYACDLLSDILANGKSSRFYKTLVREQKMMSTADCYLTGNFDAGLIIFEGRPVAGYTTEECIDAIWNEAEKIKTEPPSERELQKVKNKVIASITMNDLSVLNKAAALAYFEWLGALDDINRQEEMYQRISTEEIVTVCSKYLKPSNASFLEYVPIA